MAGKMSFIVGFGVGYVLGTRSGRERYEQIAGRAQELWRDPRVQEKAGHAQQLAKEKAGQAQQLVKGKVASSSGAAHRGDPAAPAHPGVGWPGVGDGTSS
jgi:hypothetical protein